MMNGDEYLNNNEVNKKINNRTASFDKCFSELYLLSKSVYVQYIWLCFFSEVFKWDVV